RRRLCGLDVGCRARRLGLAHSVFARLGGGDRRLLSTPACHGCGPGGAAQARPDPGDAHWRIVLGFAGLSAFNAVGFYVGFVYLVSWLQTADGIAPARALEINSLSMAIMLPVVIATGFLTDRVGRKPSLLLAWRLGSVGAVRIFLSWNRPWALSAQLGQLGLGGVIGLYGGTLPAIMVETAPLPVRCTAVALGYNITFGVIGGFTPLVAAWLV